MAIRLNLDVMMAKRKMSLTQLSNHVGITMANMSILKTGKAKAIRFETLNKICEALHCQPGDILLFKTIFSSIIKRSTTEDDIVILIKISILGLSFAVL